MELKVLNLSGKEAEFEIVGGEYTLGEVLTAKLNQKEGVEFASYKKEHPIVSNPVIYVRVKSGTAVKVVTSALDELQKEVKEFKEALKKVR